MGQSLVAGAGLKVRGLICDMVVRFRTSLVTKRALLTTSSLGYLFNSRHAPTQPQGGLARRPVTGRCSQAVGVILMSPPTHPQPISFQRLKCSLIQKREKKFTYTTKNVVLRYPHLGFPPAAIVDPQTPWPPAGMEAVREAAVGSPGGRHETVTLQAETRPLIAARLRRAPPLRSARTGRPLLAE